MKTKKYSKAPLDAKDRINMKPVICYPIDDFKENNLSILHRPKIFSEYAVPIEQRPVYVENLKKLLAFPVSVYYATRFRNEVKYLIKKYSTSVYVKALHSKLQEEISEQDSHRSLKLKEVDSFLYSWIYR